MTDLIVHHARITTLDPLQPDATALAVRDGRIEAVGDDASIMSLRQKETRVIDGGGRRLIPGLIDSHTHVIRGGLTYNIELRWDAVRSLADAMAMLAAQVAVTPAPQWVRVVGGFTEHQFVERRLPTLDELNRVAPETPVLILRLYDRALLNRAALRAAGYDRHSNDPPGGEIQRDARGEPTGLLLARPNAFLLYSTLSKAPRLSPEHQLGSTRHFMRELNRLGITSVIDAGGGFQRYPDDYAIVRKLAADDQLTVRIAYNLFPQTPGAELDDFTSWTGMVRPGDGDAQLRHNGAGEMLVFSAADFEDFREPRPELGAGMEAELERVVRLLAEKRWPFRMHATYDETIQRALTVFERVHRDIPLDGLRWFFDHAETISERSIHRVAALGGGIAFQHRMAFQGEDFVARYGVDAAANAPPIRRMLAAGLPLGAGTDATRVASYNPWYALAWMVTGRTRGGMQLYPDVNRVDRETALRLWTERNAWFSGETGSKGSLRAGWLADFALLSDDYFTIAEEQIETLSSVLTVLGGRVVHGSGGFRDLAPPLPPAMPDWSPVARATTLVRALPGLSPGACRIHSSAASRPTLDESLWGAMGCSCWAF
jgi:hypothetical protein